MVRRRLVMLWTVAALFAAVPLITPTAAHATTTGDACNTFTWSDGSKGQFCLTVEDAFNGGVHQVRYRSHLYCEGVRCNMQDAAAELRYCASFDPALCPTGGDGTLGTRNLGNVQNVTDHAFVGSWHGTTRFSYQSNSNAISLRNVNTGQLFSTSVACSWFVNVNNHDLDPQACP